MTGGPRRLKKALDMSTAAFSIPDRSRQRVSINRRGKQLTTATSAAADEALRQIIEDRRRRHKHGDLPPKPSSLGRALESVTTPVQDSIQRLGIGRFAFAAIVLGSAGIVLAIAVFTLSPSAPPCPVHALSGRLIVGKSIPAGAQITLLARSGPLPEDAVPRAVVRADGTFTFGTFSKEDGVPAGDYVALVQWFRVSKDGSGGANALPTKYSSMATSPLSVTVTDGPNPPVEFVIKK